MIPKTAAPPRAVRAEDVGLWKPLYAVWELTMKCDQPCAHCGSRAGHARDEELSTEEVLETAKALADLGCREIALIGGEAYLRTDIHEIVRYLASRGIRTAMQTGGRAMTTERAKALADAGLLAMGVSVDGPAPVHDVLRGNVGSYDAAIRALDAARAAGLAVSANTQINRLNQPHLRSLCKELRAHGIQSWQVQLTVPMGRAADRPDWILEPWKVVDVIDTLAAIQREAMETYVPGTIPFNVFCGNNIGYFGPHELTLRSRPGGDEAHWGGCKAGQHVIGIESDGSVKACPSLPTGPYVGGNVRDGGLAKVWFESPIVGFTRERTVEDLWGFCRTCYYAEVCMAGCNWTAHCTLGKPGNNPFCYHRVTQLKKKGIRERLVPAEAAPDEPYDFGRLEIVEEPWVDEAPPPPLALRPLKRLPLVQR